jgi:hypothetical protein
MPKLVHSYPDGERLDVLILANSPCTTSELLKLEHIPVKPNTLETLKKKLDILCKGGKIKCKKVAQGNVYWHSSIEDFKAKSLTKATENLVQTEAKL